MIPNEIKYISSNNLNEIYNTGSLKVGKNVISNELTFVVHSDDYYGLDSAVIKMNDKIFYDFEKKRKKKKEQTDKIIKLIDLPFGLWQCTLCGVVNKIHQWPICFNKCTV